MTVGSLSTLNNEGQVVCILTCGSVTVKLLRFLHRITLGNQLDGVRLLDPDVTARFKKRYPDGIVLKPSTTKT